MTIAISGVTLAGNLGGVAMLLTVRQEVMRRFPDAELALLSISPARDRAVAAPSQLRVVPCHWMMLICVFLPLCVVAAPFKRFRVVRTLLGSFEYFRALFRSRAIVDVSGIAFVDGRGPALLAYNLACCAPAFLLGRPVIKLAQTLGPFEEALNRRAAQWALSRCAVVIARGEKSGRHLHRVGFREPLVRPDVTFCLKVAAATRVTAREQLQRASGGEAPVMLSPSRVLQRTCDQHGIDLAGVFAGLVTRLRESGHNVALLAHSRAAGIAKNDDPATCAEILDRLPDSARPPVLATDDPIYARALIGAAGLFVGCRYHALASAYAMAVPAIALSWNHKYDDLAALFGQSEWLVTADALKLDPLYTRVVELQSRATEIRATLAQRGPAIAAAAADNFTALEELIARQTN
jgi:colanic acid/amylovoran biosynthesis protein